MISSQAMQKIVSKSNLLFFIGNKDTTGRQQILCLESAKLFFGTGPQLCFQLWIIGASSSPSVTQYLSIVSSFLLGTKLAYQLLTYSREEEGSQLKNQKNGWKAKFSTLPKDIKKDARIRSLRYRSGRRKRSTRRYWTSCACLNRQRQH